MNRVHESLTIRITKPLFVTNELFHFFSIGIFFLCMMLTLNWIIRGISPQYKSKILNLTSSFRFSNFPARCCTWFVVYNNIHRITILRIILLPYSLRYVRVKSLCSVFRSYLL